MHHIANNILKKNRESSGCCISVLSIAILDRNPFFSSSYCFFPSFCIGGVFHIFVLEVLKFVNPIQYYNYSSMCVYFSVPVLTLFCISHDRLVIPIAEESHSADVVGH